MVEDERRRVRRVGHDDGSRVVAGDRLARGRRDVDDRDRMAARVARRVGIDAQHLAELHVEAGFLARLAHRRMLDRLADVHEAARQGMARRRMAAADHARWAGPGGPRAR